MFSLSFMQIVALKKWDIGFQLSAFTIMIYCFPNRSLEIGPFAMYIVALAQIISCAFWGIVMMNKPVTRRRKNLQLIFTITTITLSGIAIYSLELLFGVSWAVMIWLGPILSISYFITTVREVSFYRSLVYKDAI